MALQARARSAATGWRLPRGLRKAGSAAKTSSNGRACGIIAPAPSKRFGSCEGVPCQESPHVVQTLYGPADTSCQLLRRKLNDPADAHLALAVQYLVCIMDILHLLARYYGTGELHEHEYLRLVA